MHVQIVNSAELVAEAFKQVGLQPYRIAAVRISGPFAAGNQGSKS